MLKEIKERIEKSGYRIPKKTREFFNEKTGDGYISWSGHSIEIHPGRAIYHCFDSAKQELIYS